MLNINHFIQTADSYLAQEGFGEKNDVAEGWEHIQFKCNYVNLYKVDTL